MDDQRQAKRIEKANKLMNQLNDPVWLKPSAELEGNSSVEAGNGLCDYVKRFKAIA